MKKHELSAEKRTLVGRKVKTLRKIGKIPATIYGKKVHSQSITLVEKDFQKVYAVAGNSGLIELNVDGTVKPVLVHTVQVQPVTDAILHVELHQVDLKEKVHAKVPLVLVGESAAVIQKVGVVLTITDEVDVEALPTDLPEKIEVNISTLAAVDDEVAVKDLRVSSGVTILTEPDVTLVKIGALVSREAEAEMKAEAAAKAAETAEVPVEGQGIETQPSQEISQEGKQKAIESAKGETRDQAKQARRDE